MKPRAAMGLVLLVPLLLLASMPPAAVGQAPPPPTGASDAPIVTPRQGEEVSVPIDGARNGGRMRSATSSNPSVVAVDIIETGSFTGLSIRCVGQHRDPQTVTYTYTDSTGKVQTGAIIVSCGSLVTIGRALTVVAPAGEAVKIESPDLRNAQVGQNEAPEARLDADTQNGTLTITPNSNQPPGTYIIPYSIGGADGILRQWTIVLVVEPRRVSQVTVPENTVRQAASSVGCPAGSPRSAERSGMATSFVGYYRQSFGDQFVPMDVPGIRNVYFTTCQPSLTGDSRQDANAPPSYSFGGLVTEAPQVRPVLDGIARNFARRVQSSNPPQNVSGLGNQAVGVSGRVPLSDGRQIMSGAVVASWANSVYWMSGQGMGLSLLTDPTIQRSLREYQRLMEAGAAMRFPAGLTSIRTTRSVR